jgi:lambda family phage portal protein
MRKSISMILNKVGLYTKTQTKRIFARGFDAAVKDRLSFSWGTTNTTLDYDLKKDLRNVRARSRDLAVNNDYARKFLKVCVSNIIGKKGIGFQSKVKDANGEFDKAANDKIELAWNDWGKNCCVDGMTTWLEVQKICVESMARDGEIIIRHVKGYNNKFGYALQLIESDHLDEDMNQTLPNGNEIRMGIEFNKDNRPVNYYLLVKHPGDGNYSIGGKGKTYKVIPADEISHIFSKERVSQSRGFPWMASAMKRLNMLHGYEESELVAARISASKMGFYTKPDNSLPGEVADYKDSNGDFVDEVEPGKFTTLPMGYDFKEFDPTHPTGNFDPFTKSILRGAAAGLNIQYHTLSGDLTSVSFSSIRSGTIEERDNWRTIQYMLIDKLCVPVFDVFLEMALLTQVIPLPYYKIDKFNAPAWQPRQFDWVDPEKDINANVTAINARLKTRSDVAGEQGKDFEEIIDQLAWEEKLIKDKGLMPIIPIKKEPTNGNGQNTE